MEIIIMAVKLQSTTKTPTLCSNPPANFCIIQRGNHFINENENTCC